MTAIEVWGCGTPRTLRVYWALHELGLAYTRYPVRTRTTDMDNVDFTAVSPGRKIPAFRHEEVVLRESGAIVEYLFALAGKRPADPGSAARIEQWTCFALMELDATALYVLRRHRGLPEIYGAAPAAVDSAEAYFARQADVAAAALADGREFIEGPALTKADIVLASCCLWAEHEQLDLPTALGAYAARLLARPACRQALAANQPD